MPSYKMNLSMCGRGLMSEHRTRRIRSLCGVPCASEASHYQDTDKTYLMLILARRCRQPRNTILYGVTGGLLLDAGAGLGLLQQRGRPLMDCMSTVVSRTPINTTVKNRSHLELEH
jgi:hypothetical protein